MLIRLEPDQVSRYWDALRDGVRKGLPPTAVNDEERMANILSALLTQRAQAWVIMQDGGVVGVIVTLILVEELTQTRNLILYAFGGLDSIRRETWMGGLKDLQAYARDMKCEKIGAFTTHKGIAELLRRRVPGVTEQSYIDIPVAV